MSMFIDWVIDKIFHLLTLNKRVWDYSYAKCTSKLSPNRFLFIAYLPVYYRSTGVPCKSLDSPIRLAILISIMCCFAFLYLYDY